MFNTCEVILSGDLWSFPLVFCFSEVENFLAVFLIRCEEFCCSITGGPSGFTRCFIQGFFPWVAQRNNIWPYLLSTVLGIQYINNGEIIINDILHWKILFILHRSWASERWGKIVINWKDLPIICNNINLASGDVQAHSWKAYNCLCCSFKSVWSSFCLFTLCYLSDCVFIFWRKKKATKAK